MEALEFLKDKNTTFELSDKNKIIKFCKEIKKLGVAHIEIEPDDSTDHPYADHLIIHLPMSFGHRLQILSYIQKCSIDLFSTEGMILNIGSSFTNSKNPNWETAKSVCLFWNY